MFCKNDREISQITLTFTVSKDVTMSNKIQVKNTVTELDEFRGLLSKKENGRQPNESTNSDKKSLNSDWRFWDKDLPNEKKLYEYFWQRHSVFSQWYPCKFTVDDIPYTSAEQYMMHQKAGKIFCFSSSQIWSDNLCLFCFALTYVPE